MNTRMTTLAAALCGLLTLTVVAAEPVLDVSGNARVLIEETPAVSQNFTALTIECWIKPARVFSSYAMAIHRNTQDTTIGRSLWFIGFNLSGQLVVTINAVHPNNAWQNGQTTVVPAANQWHHVAGTWDGATGYVYLNGVLIHTYASNPMSANMTQANAFALGATGLGTAVYPYDGLISDVRLWEVKRTQEQIAATMGLRLTGTEPGLVGYWPLAEGAGTFTLDQTFNLSDGTLDGAGWTTAGDLTLLPPNAEFVGALPFTVADIESGSTEFTNSNEVEVVDFPVPEGYDRYQINPYGDPGMIDSNSWAATSMPPQTASFDLPVADTTNVILYAWFTNSTATVPLRRAAATITFTRVPPQPAASFTGSDSYIDLGAPDALQIPSNEPFTVEGWLYLNARSTRDMLFCKNKNRSSPYTYMLGFADGGKLVAYDGSTWRYASPAVYSLEQQWMHLAFSFDGTTMSFYFNGALKGTAPYSFINDPSHTVKIGGFNTAADIDGLISDVRIWNHARNAAQIQAAMQHRLSGNETGLRGYWPLFENEGSQVRDYSLFANHGELIGAGWVESQTLGLVLQADAFLLARPFGLANPTTGSTEFTNSNEVDVVNFAIPAGYDHYQINQNGDSAAITSNNWTATNDLPDQLTFDLPATDSNIVFYAWFTNMAESVTVARAAAGIHYSKVNPVSIARATHSRKLIPGQPVVLQAAEIDTGSSGGETGGLSIPIHALSLNLVSGPDTNATPQAPAVTVAALGSYEVELVVMNAAGNVATSSVCQVEVTAYGGETFTWTGAVDAYWHNALNWNWNAVPITGSEVVIGQGASVLLSAATPSLAALTMTGGTLTFDGWQSCLHAESVAVYTGMVTHAQNNDLEEPWEPNARVWFDCTDLTLATTASIDVDKKGYTGGAQGYVAGNGPGGGYRSSYGTGGAYGGYGATRDSYTDPKNKLPYGGAAAPESPGSGGGSSGGSAGGNGGGAVKIDADGTVTINGVISANGGGPSGNHASGGSGGAISIQCAHFSGTNGTLRAGGGNGLGFGSAGGGGRIAVVYELPEQAPQIINMTFDTTPGINGTADIGSLWFPDSAILESPGVQIVGQIYNLASWTVDSLTITNSRLRFRDEGFRLTVSNDLTVSGPAARLELGGTVVSNLYRVDFFGTETAPCLEVGGDLTVVDGGRFEVYAGLTNGAADGWGAQILVGGTLRIGEGSGVYAKSEPLNGGSPLFEIGGLVVASNGVFSAEGLGFTGGHAGKGYGPGKGSGAGYGGRGGRSPYGMPYGPRDRPAYAGSGGIGSSYGHAGNGGGLIRVVTRGLAHIDGTVNVDAGLLNGNHNSGGAGGGIFIECAKFRGAPYALLTARGSRGYSSAKSNDGGGGGGRIAVWSGKAYTEGISPNRLVLSQTPPATFSGLVDVVGGVSSTPGYDGEPGTMVFVTVLPPQGTMLLLR